MFFIPGWLIGIITFPGVIVHEAAHRFFCDLAKVPVYDVCYFRVGNPAGYVVHAVTPSLRANFLISVGPLLINTVLCAVFGFTPAIVYTLSPANAPGVFFLLLWLAISIGMHAFPSGQDMNNFVESVRVSNHPGPLLFVSKAFALLLRIANALRIVWFDAIYAVVVAMIVPLILVGV